MGLIRGKLLAVRPKTITSRRGEHQSFQSFQVAYIPAEDAHGFPAVMNCGHDVFEELQGLQGSTVELRYIETPPYGDKLVTAASVMAQAAG